jgi:hypothetical protein
MLFVLIIDIYSIYYYPISHDHFFSYQFLVNLLLHSNTTDHNTHSLHSPELPCTELKNGKLND